MTTSSHIYRWHRRFDITVITLRSRSSNQIPLTYRQWSASVLSKDSFTNGNKVFSLALTVGSHLVYRIVKWIKLLYYKFSEKRYTIVIC